MNTIYLYNTKTSEIGFGAAKDVDLFELLKKDGWIKITKKEYFRLQETINRAIVDKDNKAMKFDKILEYVQSMVSEMNSGRLPRNDYYENPEELLYFIENL